MGCEGKDEHGDSIYRLADLVLTDRFPAMTGYSYEVRLEDSGRYVTHVPHKEISILAHGREEVLLRQAVRSDEEALEVIEANRGTRLNKVFGSRANPALDTPCPRRLSWAEENAGTRRGRADGQTQRDGLHLLQRYA